MALNIKKYFGGRVFTVVVICSLLLIAEMVSELQEQIFHVDWYRAMFIDQPQWLVSLRYNASILRHVVIILCAVGLILKRHAARKCLLVIAWFDILTLYLRHPYSSFENISRYTGLNTEDFLQTVVILGKTYHPGVLNRMFLVCLEDLLISLAILIICTSPKVKALFK